VDLLAVEERLFSLDRVDHLEQAPVAAPHTLTYPDNTRPHQARENLSQKRRETPCGSARSQLHSGAWPVPTSQVK
jgi:hypothetical protein